MPKIVLENDLETRKNVQDVERGIEQSNARTVEFQESASNLVNSPDNGSVAWMARSTKGDPHFGNFGHEGSNFLQSLPNSRNPSNQSIRGIQLPSFRSLVQRSSRQPEKKPLMDNVGGVHQTAELPKVNTRREENGILVCPYTFPPNCHVIANPFMLDLQLANSFLNGQGALNMWSHAASDSRSYPCHENNNNRNVPFPTVMEPNIFQEPIDSLSAFKRKISSIHHGDGYFQHIPFGNPPSSTPLQRQPKSQPYYSSQRLNTPASMEHLQRSKSAAVHHEYGHLQNISFGNPTRTTSLQSQPKTQPFYSSQQAKRALSMEHLQELATKLESVANSTDEIEPPPGYMVTELLRHQRIALHWMTQRENEGSKPLGGILADDQGLGKTVTTISLIVNSPRAGVQHRKVLNLTAEDDGTPKRLDCESAVIGGDSLQSQKMVDVVDLTDSTAKTSLRGPSKSSCKRDNDGGTLVVCPKTLLYQWAKEIRDKTTKMANCSVYIYHGQSRNILQKTLERCTVVLTTYETLVSEMPENKKPERKQSAGIDEKMVDLTTCPEMNENQRKKQKRAMSDKGGPLFRIRWHRLVLDEAQEIKNAQTLAAHAACAIKATRRWCLSGTPLQNSIDDLYSYLKFLRHYPLSDFTEFKSLIRDPISRNRPEIGFQRLHTYLAPILLRRTKSSKIDGEPIVELPERRVNILRCKFNEKERNFYCKLESEAQIKVKQMQEDGSMGQNYFNMLWMCLRLRQACNHPRLVRNLEQEKNSIVQEEVKAFRQLSESKRDNLLKCLEDSALECVACLDPADDPVISKCCHIFCRQCVSTRLSDASQGNLGTSPSYRCPSCEKLLGSRDTYSLQALHSLNGNAENFSRTENEDNVNELHMQDSSKIIALMDLLKSLRKDGEARMQESSKRIEAVVRLSAKRTAKRLSCGASKPAFKSIAPSAPPHQHTEKAIVFSQWTSMLDIVQESLIENKFIFRRLDGTMNLSARQEAIEDFTSNPEVTVMLVSLKAASLGVNLVSANHVVLLDLWYNPSTEEQAIDRTHRIGQTRPVSVTRITIEGTIEDRILELQEKKRGLAEAALGNGDLRTAVNKLTVNDLCNLFRVS